MKKILALLLLFSGVSYAQNVNIPDPVLKAYLLSADATNSIAMDNNNISIRIDTNNNNEIELSEAALVPRLYIDATGISDLTGIKEFVNLQSIDMAHGTMTSLDFSNMSQLTYIDVSDFPVTDFNFSGATNVESFRFANCPALVALDLRNLSGLVTVLTDPLNTTLKSINAAGLQNLTSIQATENHVTNLDISGTAQFQMNQPGIFNYLQNCNASNSGVINLVVNSMDLTTVNASNCTALRNINILSNVGVSSLNLSNCPVLEVIDITGFSFSSFNFIGATALKELSMMRNANMTSLDLSRQYQLDYLFIDGPIEYINLKNGNREVFEEHNGELSALKYICADEEEIAYLTGNVPETVLIHSYCSATPGGNYNTISGNIRFDANNNACDPTDAALRFIKIKANSGSEINATITDIDGSYAVYTLAGDFSFGPVLERPEIFNIAPSGANANFADNNNNTVTQDFCISANGIRPDLEIVIAPLTTARPGFDATYKIVYKNKGNQALSGDVVFNFDDNITDFVSAAPIPTSQSNGLLTFNFSDLLPFESREIILTLNINSPTETPPVNLNDVLRYTATINPVATDDMPVDNIFEFLHVAINSYDPNDKTCLEGTTITPDHIGKYLHYNINFENTGNADAINVVVKDYIDPLKFDIHSLQVLNSSHAVKIKVSGNIIEFIFENINLRPSAQYPIGGHGNVLFKIKTNSNLTVGDTVENTANIYFDYNAPIETNEAKTTFALLNNQNFEHDNSVTAYPNPASDFVKIQSQNIVKSIQLFDIQGRILQTTIENKKETTLDLSEQSNGIYFVKINTEKGSKVEKIIKE